VSESINVLTLLLVVIAGLIGGVVGAAVVGSRGPQPRTAQPPPPPVPPRTEPAKLSKLELVDAAGKARIAMEVLPSGLQGGR
jgi:multidrug efflux pump subunit AcrA (membrane-fusion protein)